MWLWWVGGKEERRRGRRKKNLLEVNIEGVGLFHTYLFESAEQHYRLSRCGFWYRFWYGFLYDLARYGSVYARTQVHSCTDASAQLHGRKHTHTNPYMKIYMNIHTHALTIFVKYCNLKKIWNPQKKTRNYRRKQCNLSVQLSGCTIYTQLCS